MAGPTARTGRPPPPPPLPAGPLTQTRTPVAPPIPPTRTHSPPSSHSSLSPFLDLDRGNPPDPIAPSPPRSPPTPPCRDDHASSPDAIAGLPLSVASSPTSSSTPRCLDPTIPR